MKEQSGWRRAQLNYDAKAAEEEAAAANSIKAIDSFTEGEIGVWQPHHRVSGSGKA